MSFRRIDFEKECPLKEKLTKSKKKEKPHTKTAYVARGQKILKIRKNLHLQYLISSIGQHAVQCLRKICPMTV